MPSSQPDDLNPYGLQGDLFQWSTVLDVIDVELAKEDSSRELVLAALRFSRSLLENCSNRHVYNSYEVRLVL